MHRPWLLTALVLTLFLCSHVLAANSGFSPCEIGNTQASGNLAAECLTLTIAENPSDPESAPIELHVAKLAARSTDQRKDPLTILVGGPGQAASETFPSVAQAFEKIRKKRDIYLIDQRGTGLSNRLACAQIEDEFDEEIDPFIFDPEALERQTRDCRDALDADPRFYTTSIAVRDLEHVRSELNIDTWNIYGISYGTRVGLHYLRLFPDRVRTLILDAVVPPDFSLGKNIASDAQRALDLLLQRCSNSESCARQFPDLRQTTNSLLADLSKAPRLIQFENFNTGKLSEIEFTLHHLTLTLRMMTYSSHGVALLPVLLNDAYHNNNFAPLARQAHLQSKKLMQSLATGMHNSVICTEDQPYVTLDDALQQKLAETYLGSTPLQALASSCRHWPVGFIDEHFKSPVKSDKPVLILSGEADPVTPPSNGERVAAHLPNALHIVNPGQGHMQAHLGCMPTIMLDFIERGSTADIDPACLQRLRPLPFFIDANGPTP